MRILVNKFVDNKPSAREITLGYTTFWFAGEHMIAMKYLSNMYGKYPSSGYASQIREYLPKYMISNDWNKYMKSVMPLYMYCPARHQKLTLSGTTTNAFYSIRRSAKYTLAMIT
jgi:hypothetical protein